MAMNKEQESIYWWFFTKKGLTLLVEQLDGIIGAFKSDLSPTYKEMKIEVCSWCGVDLLRFELVELDNIINQV